MAKRDVRRHKGRSALVMVMVALPTLLLVFAITTATTSQISGAEQIPGRMGNGVASIDWPQGGAVIQAFDPGTSWGDDGDAKPIPGWVADGSAFDNAEAISALTGATAIPFLTESASTRIGDRRVNLNTLALDPRQGLTGKVELDSGRLPERAGEALVSRVGAGRGLPSKGTLTVRAGGAETTVTVVGTALVRGGGSYAPEADLVTPQPLVAGQPGSGWILMGTTSVSWSEVQRLNSYGLPVWSAALLKDPPPVSELDPKMQATVRSGTTRMSTFVAVGGALLLVVTTLLVGPAFAVSAARQRRTLALSASNGATAAQLRHSVLAQALVLGVASALIGSALGIAAAWAATHTRLQAIFAPSGAPFDVPPLPIVLVTMIAALSAVIAALIPARRLGRLDIIGVMKGQSVSPPPSRTVFVIGAVLAGVGGFAVISLAAGMAQSDAGGGEIMIVSATIALIVGAIMLAPMALVLIARLSSRLPVSLRMATRDAGRQRSRSVPSIAAILAGVAVLTMSLIASGSDAEQSRRQYTATNAAGDATVYANGGTATSELDVPGLTSAFSGVRSGLTMAPVTAIDTGDPWQRGKGDVQPTKPWDQLSVNVVPPGCTPQQTVADQPEGPSGPLPNCHVAGTEAHGNFTGISLLPKEEIVRRLTVLGDRDAADAVAKGAIVIGRVPGQKSIIADGQATVMTGTQVMTPNGEPSTLKDVRTMTVPAVEVELTKESTGTMLTRAVLAPDEVAKTAGWPTFVERLTIHDPSGPISTELGEQLAAAAPNDIWVDAERGYQSPLKWIILILLGIFTLLLLVITLTSTALSLAEQEKDQATLAALGSGRGTRRVMAAAQAFALCSIGVVLGLAVGVVPGIALTYPLTAQNWDPFTGDSVAANPVIVIPWLVLLGFALAVPTIAAALAAAGIRKAPTATHRTA